MMKTALPNEKASSISSVGAPISPTQPLGPKSAKVGFEEPLRDLIETLLALLTSTGDISQMSIGS